MKTNFNTTPLHTLHPLNSFNPKVSKLNFNNSNNNNKKIKEIEKFQKKTRWAWAFALFNKIVPVLNQFKEDSSGMARKVVNFNFQLIWMSLWKKEWSEW